MESTFNLKGKFKFECFDKDGNLKWVNEADNAATDEGLTVSLTSIFTPPRRFQPGTSA